MKRPCLSLLALVLSSACLRVQADAPICKTASLEFSGAPATNSRAAISTEQDITFGSGIDASMLHSLTLGGGTITPGDGTPELSFLDHLDITVAAPAGSGLPDLPVLTWTRQGTSPVAAIAIQPRSTDMIPYFVNGLSLHVSAGGTPPPVAWSLLVDLCADASVDQTVKLF